MSLLLVLALGQYSPLPDVSGPIYSQPSLMGSLAFFEFAPASGAGMGATCACAAITGAKGETVTFTRTGDAVCSKGGLATTGIADGDLVTCASDQPRVERQSDGTLALRVESSRTNVAIRWAETDNAAWANSLSGVGAPTITANHAVSPDGTTSAERFQFPATGAGQYAVRFQPTTSCNSTTCSLGLFVRGTSGSGSIDLCSWGTGGTPGTGCNTCPYVETEWRRCTVTHTNTSPSYILFGSDSSGVRPTHPAEDVLVWGTTAEVGAFATSPIPTVAAAVTQNAETAYATLPVTVSPGSIAGSVSVPWATTATNTRLVRVDSSGSDTDRFELFFNSSPSVASFVSVSASSQQVTGAAFSLPGFFRAAGWRIPSTTQAVVTVSETTAATALGALPALNRVYLGVYAPATGFELNGLVSRVCVDPSPTRCR